MSEHFKKTVTFANQIRFHALELGAGPLALCLHGFPDTAWSFRHQLPALAAAGYRAVAPYMRGYAPTDPAPDGRYDLRALAEDALALITALGYDDAALIGHDWGAVAAYGAAAAAPQKINKLITIAVPYGPQFFRALASDYAQQRRSWYMFFFQTALAEAAIRHNDFEFLEKLWNDWSPGWRWSGIEMSELKESFRHPGTVEAALGYYRASIGPALKAPAPDPGSPPAVTVLIEAPTLYLHGRNDGCIGFELLEGMADYFTKGLEVKTLEHAGHFAHQEKPEEVNQLMLDFLAA
jgi:pimeloyl-ACP methyl ester carboxylesterase